MTSGSVDQPEQDLEQLILLAVKGDQEAFGALYSRHLNAIYRYIFFRVGDEKEAEDLTEEVFVKAWEALPKYRLTGYPFTSWLYRIAHNQTVDYHRKRSAVTFSDTDLVRLKTTASSTEDIIEDRQRLGALASAVQRLEDWEQDVIILRFVHGIPYEEIAAIIGKSVNATRVMQHRALAKLSKYMKSEDQDNG